MNSIKFTVTLHQIDDKLKTLLDGKLGELLDYIEFRAIIGQVFSYLEQAKGDWLESVRFFEHWNKVKLNAIAREAIIKLLQHISFIDVVIESKKVKFRWSINPLYEPFYQKFSELEIEFITCFFSREALDSLIREVVKEDSIRESVSRFMGSKVLEKVIVERENKARTYRGLQHPIGLPMELPITNKMKKILASNSVQLHTARILPPKIGSFKVLCDLDFSDFEDKLYPSINFIDNVGTSKWHKNNVRSKPPSKNQLSKISKLEQNIIGVDLNRLSEFVIAAASPKQIFDVRKYLFKIILLKNKLEWINFAVLKNNPSGNLSEYHFFLLKKFRKVGNRQGFLYDFHDLLSREAPSFAPDLNIYILNLSKFQDALWSYLINIAEIHRENDLILNEIDFIWDLWYKTKNIELILTWLNVFKALQSDVEVLFELGQFSVPNPFDFIKNVKGRLKDSMNSKDYWKLDFSIKSLIFRHRTGIRGQIEKVTRALNLNENYLEILTQSRDNQGALRYNLNHILSKISSGVEISKKIRKFSIMERVNFVIKYLTSKIGRLNTELTLIWQRKGKIKVAIDRETSFAGARFLIDFNAKMLVAEDLHLSTQGKTKKLRRYVEDMPKRVEITSDMAKFVREYQRYIGDLTQDFNYKTVAPPGTSLFCAALDEEGNICGAKLQTVKGDYDLMFCPKCGTYIPRHGNAAMRVAQLGAEN